MKDDQASGQTASRLEGWGSAAAKVQGLAISADYQPDSGIAVDSYVQKPVLYIKTTPHFLLSKPGGYSLGKVILAPNDVKWLASG